MGLGAVAVSLSLLLSLTDRQRLEARVRELESRPSSTSQPSQSSPVVPFPSSLPPFDGSEPGPSNFQLHNPGRNGHSSLGAYSMPWVSTRAPHSSYSAVREPEPVVDSSQSVKKSPTSGNVGTLVVTAGGRSKFLGPGAASQQLREASRISSEESEVRSHAVGCE